MVTRGNDISIRENDGVNAVSTDNKSDSDDHGDHQSETHSDESHKSFDYLIADEAEVADEDDHEVGDEERATIDVDKYGEIDDNGVKGNVSRVAENEASYQVVSLVDDHTCVRNFNYGRLCRNGKKFALTEGDVTIQYHYGYLRSYAKALVESNEGSTVKVGVTVNPDEKTYFDRFIGDDLELPNGIGLTLMFDQHKGLIEAFKDVMPLAEHRQCARHIYEGFRKQFSGVEFKELFLADSKASYPHLFNKIMEKIKRENPRGHQYLLLKDLKTWSRAFFTEAYSSQQINMAYLLLLDTAYRSSGTETEILKELQEVMADPILFDNLEKAPTESNLSITSNDINIELSKEFLLELRKNIYHGTYNEDVVDHIVKVLKMVDLIYVPGVDSHQLRMKVFPLSLADDAKEWWISEEITTWEELVKRLFYRFYPESYDGEDDMLDEGEN
ncbi:pentatricopeptide repeat-containing protein [Tanacetum coccineum]